MTVEQARRLALALPEATEQEHWGNPSFRIHGRIFATLPDREHLNVMIESLDIEAVVNENPQFCEELWWGKELRGVRVSMNRAAAPVVKSLLEAAWRRKAPKRLLT
jgi:hypothetical protein